MTDPIDSLTAAQEQKLADALEAAVAAAIDAISPMMLTAIFANADHEGEEAYEHYQAQLASFLGTDTTDYTALAGALDAGGMMIGAGSFFAAVLSLAAAQARHVANTNATDAAQARNSAIRAFRTSYLHESLLALRETAQWMLKATGSSDSRAGQVRRVIGLSSNQARSLHVLREALAAHAADPTRDASLILAGTRGYLSAAQLQLVRKAIRTRTSPAAAEALLNKHAKAMRSARARAVAGNVAHQLAETAKLTGWQIAQRFGALPADQRRYWRTAGDERVRLAHAQVPGMNRDGVPLDQLFATPLGQCFTPPLEPGCRCKAVLKRTA